MRCAPSAARDPSRLSRINIVKGPRMQAGSRASSARTPARSSCPSTSSCRGTLPWWVSLCLIAAGVGFPLAQVGGFAWALTWAYPAACVLWLVALWSVAAGSFEPGREGGE
jgi:hypothetical protein